MVPSPPEPSALFTQDPVPLVLGPLGLYPCVTGYPLVIHPVPIFGPVMEGNASPILVVGWFLVILWHWLIHWDIELGDGHLVSHIPWVIHIGLVSWVSRVRLVGQGGLVTVAVWLRGGSRPVFW